MALIAQDKFPQDRLDATARTGLILCGMGGPDGPDTVRPFLRNLFRDPMIFPAPRAIAPLLGWAIARFRSPGVAERYRQMSPDCVSPQIETTRLQAAEISHLLQGYGLDVAPAIAMRYWRPFPETAVQELAGHGVGQYLVVPMYPQYSSATNGSTLEAVVAAIRTRDEQARVHVVPGWGMLPGFLSALARPAVETLCGWAEAGADPRECRLLYVAHSLPQTFIDQGDPYLSYTEATVQAVHERVARRLAEAGHGPWADRAFAGFEPAPVFQSKVGPIKWLGPEVTAVVAALGAAGCRRLMVQPVSFTCEHIETLIELDDELKADAEAAGISEFRRGPALNLDHEWLRSMAAMLADQAFTAEVPHRA